MGNINQELERLQLISDFLKGKFSPKQLEKFNKRLENDPVLQEELYKHKKLVELLKKKQEQNISSLLDQKNDVDYMKQERIYRRNQLRQELEKIKEQKTEQQQSWERKVAQSNQPSIYKIAAVFFGAIAIGTSVFVVATSLIDEQNEKALQAEISVPTLVEVETNPADALDKSEDNSLFSSKNKEIIAQNSTTEKDRTTTSQQQQTISETENLLAFQPIAELENKLNQNTRSSINLKSPNTDVENYTQNLIFEWSGTSEEEIYLEVINSRKETTKFENLTTPFTLEQNFEKGIYYWVLQTDSEVIKRGKFLVK
ncbi:hypothetical protein V9L05_09165 [Bernardetia sp. Wsw4-3y2]|uniref:hypothetical protein n=1 Tax=Bernardetia sp. Wsw4-3y2 TaxID=3127471 RepID=UPI0030CFEF3D